MRKAQSSPSSGSSNRLQFVIAGVVIILLVALLVWWLSKAGPIGPSKVWPEPEARKATLSENNLVYAGLPKALASDSEYVLLRNRGYELGYSEKHKNPLWVAYRLDAKTNPQTFKRPSKFEMDPRTLSKVRSDEYDRSGYDRGHMAPNSAIAHNYGKEAQIETFLLSNICPQSPNLNRKLWARLERLEADQWAVGRNSVWVMDGPVFSKSPSTLPSGVEIPEQFYKITVDEATSDIEIQAFLIPQTVHGSESPEQFLTSVETIQNLTHLDFFPAISDVREKNLESRSPSQIWR